MRTAKLLLRIPGNWIGELSMRCNASVKVLQCVPADRTTGRSLLRIEALDGKAVQGLEDALKSIGPDCHVDLATLGPGKHIASVTNNACLICNLLNEADCFLDLAVSQPDGKIAWSVIAPRSENIGRLITRLKEMGCEVEMLNLRDQEEDGPLTFHQEKILRTAYDMGYYDIPRTATLADLSDRLGMARSTIDVVLRRAERRLIGEHIGR
ncbi:hypothetical protein AOA80_04735 [Methanomassiliicoccales archaeon RumEn M1]|nr:hypothetical protein AOA80_04735 [Methanomassiliicoccales archaeon RumEn M1]